MRFNPAHGGVRGIFFEQIFNINKALSRAKILINYSDSFIVWTYVEQ